MVPGKSLIAWSHVRCGSNSSNSSLVKTSSKSCRYSGTCSSHYFCSFFWFSLAVILDLARISNALFGSTIRMRSPFSRWISQAFVSLGSALVVFDMLQADGQQSNCSDPSVQSIEGLCFLSQSCPRKISLFPKLVTPKSIRSVCSPI